MVLPGSQPCPAVSASCSESWAHCSSTCLGSEVVVDATHTVQPAVPERANHAASWLFPLWSGLHCESGFSLALNPDHMTTASTCRSDSAAAVGSKLQASDSRLPNHGCSLCDVHNLGPRTVSYWFNSSVFLLRNPKTRFEVPSSLCSVVSIQSTRSHEELVEVKVGSGNIGA